MICHTLKYDDPLLDTKIADLDKKGISFAIDFSGSGLSHGEILATFNRIRKLHNNLSGDRHDT
jgi:hypothetical protein